jgi:hypothetical protein
MEEIPLVQGTQKKYGKGKFDVLMLSVDLGYGETLDDATKGDQAQMTRLSVTWPNVLLPKGFEETRQHFNMDGYGLMLIGPDGIVKGIDLRPEDVDELMAKTYG